MKTLLSITVAALALAATAAVVPAHAESTKAEQRASLARAYAQIEAGRTATAKDAEPSALDSVFESLGDGLSSTRTGLADGSVGHRPVQHFGRRHGPSGH